MIGNNLYVQYGCGLSAPKEWVNFDVSPTLKVQKIPFAGNFIAQKIQGFTFPENVLYGDITIGLPNIPKNSCSGVYCSHVLEHLAIEDFQRAVINTYSILKPEGIFRCVVPDLEIAAKEYLNRIIAGESFASIEFMNTTLLGVKKRPNSFLAKVKSLYGNSHHLWMWDKYSLKKELEKVGFRNVRTCTFNDCKDSKFKLEEEEGRFYKAVAIEAQK